MRRLSLFLAALLLSLTAWASPAGAAPANSPVLLEIGTATKRTTDQTQCTFVPYKVSTTSWWSLEYRGPDNLLRKAEAKGYGSYAQGQVGVCPDYSWPKGFYWLKSVQLENWSVEPNVLATVKRYDNKILYQDGSVGTYGGRLDRADFIIQ